MNVKVLTIVGVMLGASMAAQAQDSAAGSCESLGGPPSVAMVPGVPVEVAAAQSAGAASEPAASAPVESAPTASAPAPAPQVEPAPAAEVASVAPTASDPAPVDAIMAGAPTAPKEPLNAWWPAKGKGKLNILRAGAATYEKAIMIVADGAFESPESANANIKVTGSDGAPVAAKWEVAASKKTLLLDVPPGRYTVKIGEGFKDASGKTVSSASSGPVHVR